MTSVLVDSFSGRNGGERLFTGKTPRLVQGERRRVAVLFLDLTGFTPLAEKLDHEEVHKLLGELMGFLSSVVESHGGYVDKLQGDRLMALFGAKWAVENDSARALDCALKMMEVLRSTDSAMPEGVSLSARAGVHFGPVTVAPDPTGHLTATGSTVNAASRIEESARPGEVSVSHAVVKECGETYSFRELGEFDLKGLEKPMVLYTPTGPGRVRRERWERAAGLAHAPLVGRKREKERIERLLNRTSANTGDTFFIKFRGEAGIGKSRMLHHLMKKASGFTVLHGHTRPYSQPPFWIWTRMLRDYMGLRSREKAGASGRILQLARSCPDGKLGKKVKEVEPLLSEVLSAAGSAEREFSPEESGNMVTALRLLLDAIGARGKLLVAQEDTQWMDEPSRRVLKLFADSGGGPASAVVAVTERPCPNPLFAEQFQWELIGLEPMPAEDIGSIAGHLLSNGTAPADLERGLLEMLEERGGGNPLYTEELVQSLVHSGGIGRDGQGTWKLSIDPDHIQIPSSIRSLVQSRMDMLPAEDRMLLQIASVIGESFRMAVLHRVVSRLQPEADVQEAVDRLESLGFLRGESGERVSFRHDLLQSSVYSTVLKHNRRTIHALTAEALISLYPEEEKTLAPVIFTHWDRTDRREMKLEWGQKALDSALCFQQNSEIMRLAEKLLQLADRDHRDDWQVRMNAHGAMEVVLSRSGDLDRAVKLLNRTIRESRDRGVPAVEISALRRKSILLKEKGVMEEAEALLELALEKARLIEDETLTGQIYAAMGVFFADTGKVEKAGECYRKALEVFRNNSKNSMVAAIRSNLANLFLMTGNRREAVEEYKAAIGICRSAGLRSSLGYCLNGYAIAMAQLNDLDAASRLFQEALEIESDIGNLPLQSSILSNLGILTRMKGDYRKSLEYRLASLDLARKSNNRHTECISLVNAGNMYRLMGRLEEAEDNTRLGLEIADDISDIRTVCHGLSVLGMVYLQKSETQRALDHYDRARKIADKGGIGPGIVDDLDDLIEMLDERKIHHEKPRGWIVDE